jgi:hypothetical protein
MDLGTAMRMTKWELGILEVMVHLPHPLHIPLTNPMVVASLHQAAVEATLTMMGMTMMRRMKTMMTPARDPLSLILCLRTPRMQGLTSFTRPRP